MIIDIAERFVKEGGEPVDNGLKAVARREDRERAKKVTAFTCFGIEQTFRWSRNFNKTRTRN